MFGKFFFTIVAGSQELGMDRYVGHSPGLCHRISIAAVGNRFGIRMFTFVCTRLCASRMAPAVFCFVSSSHLFQCFIMRCTCDGFCLVSGSAISWLQGVAQLLELSVISKARPQNQKNCTH